MKKIGEGYYYNVYDIGNDRVYKKIKSKIRIFFFILISRVFHPDFFREYKNVTNSSENVKIKYKEIKDECNDLSLLGNPKFKENILEYTQDKVLIIKKFLEKSKTEEQKEIVEKYILLIKKLWAYGISDRVFNFTVNNGLNKNEDLILLDFNEITFSQKDIEEDIKKEIWIHRWSFSHLNPEIKNYYKKRMKEEITIENLNKIWKTKI